MLCYNIPCNFMFCNEILFNFMFFNVLLCNFMLCYVILRVLLCRAQHIVRKFLEPFVIIDICRQYELISENGWAILFVLTPRQEMVKQYCSIKL